MMNWENGLYICGNCGTEVRQDELVLVLGGIESAYCEDQPGQYVDLMTGEPVDMTPEQFERSWHQTEIQICFDCQQERENKTARRLLESL